MATKAEIAELINQLHGSEAENAECTLTGMPDTLPFVVAAYDGERDGKRRATLIHCLWEYRDYAAVPTLLRALLETDDRVWKEALDGLVTLAGDQVEEALRSVRRGLPSDQSQHTKREWLDEAIGQIAENKRPG